MFVALLIIDINLEFSEYILRLKQERHCLRKITLRFKDNFLGLTNSTGPTNPYFTNYAQSI